MRITVHDKPLVEPYEYFCKQCKTLNLALVEFDKCPVCSGEIVKGELMELNKEELLRT